jgi:hypothetical protein
MVSGCADRRHTTRRLGRRFARTDTVRIDATSSILTAR